MNKVLKWKIFIFPSCNTFISYRRNETNKFRNSKFQKENINENGYELNSKKERGINFQNSKYFCSSKTNVWMNESIAHVLLILELRLYFEIVDCDTQLNLWQSIFNVTCDDMIKCAQ